MRTPLTSLIIVAGLFSACSISINAKDIPVRGFPTGDEVLNKAAVPYEQVEPELNYQTNGFKTDLMSKVPAPGVHPRVQFSPEDIPKIRENIKNHESSKRAWERLIVKRATNKDGTPKDPAKGKDLAAISLYALITDNQELGARLAPAIVEFAKQVEAKVDKTDKEHAFPEHVWFHIRDSGMKDLSRAYDWGYGFLNDKQRSIVRAVIAKSTKGRYSHGMELPRAWRTWNWPQFSQDHVIPALAIEGEEGYDHRIWEVCSEAVVDFLTYKISPEGWDFEATGYNGLAWGGGGVQALHAVARRLSPNPLMHPHLQTQTAAYIGQQGGVNGPWFGRGDANGSAVQVELCHLMTAAYPNDPRWRMLWMNSIHSEGLGPKKNRLGGRGTYGIPFLLYPLDDTDPNSYWGQDKKYDLTYEAASRGFMGTRSNWDPKESIHMTFGNYNKLRDSGHDGPDGGTISIWGKGVAWSRGGDKGSKYSAHRAYVAIDGGHMGYGSAPGMWLPVVDEEKATSARGDMTYSHSWKIDNGRYNVWYSPMFEKDPGFYTNAWSLGKYKTLRNYEPDPTPYSREFWSLASPNYGLWNGEDRHPTRRVPNVPVERAFRSATLVRGDTNLNKGNGYPYVLTVDDIQQDENTRSYSWILTLAGKNKVVSRTHERDERKTEIIIRRIENKPKGHKGEWPPSLKKGDPLLLVRAVQRNHSGYPSIHLADEERIVIPSNSVAPDFKVLIYPHRHGDPLPITKWNAGMRSLTVEIGKQLDVINFGTSYVDRRPYGGHGMETRYTVTRKGEKIITVGGAPSLPQFTTDTGESGDFVGTKTVSFKAGGPGETIRYTTDGSEPTASSKIYTGPFQIAKTTTVKAITYAPDWAFGDAQSHDYKELVSTGFIANTPAEYKQLVRAINPKASRSSVATFTKVDLATGSITEDQASAGVALKVYELPITYWRGSKIDLTSPLMPADLEKETPIFNSYQQTLNVPRVWPSVDKRKMYMGLYSFSGYFKAEKAGKYHFKMTSAGPTSLEVAGKKLIDIPGPYHVRMSNREGSVLLGPGLHKFEAIFADPSFFTSTILPVVNFDLAVKQPSEIAFSPVATDQLFRNKDLSFSIADSVLEIGKPLTINNQTGGQLHYSTDGGKTYIGYTKPLIFDAVSTVNLWVRRGEDGTAIAKTINVVDRLGAKTKVPALSTGMIRQRFLLPTKAVFDQSVDHTGGGGSNAITHTKDTSKDLFAFTTDAKAEETVIVAEMIPDNVGGVVRAYKGYWWAPVSGLYEFTMNNEGSNKLLIDGVHIASNHNLDARPEGKVVLEAGWHEFVAMYENSYPGIWMSGPQIEKRELLVSDFFNPTSAVEKPFHAEIGNKPSSFLMGAWFQIDGTTKIDTRVSSEVFGATKADGGAYHLSGDKSMILLRTISQSSEDITVSMWIKPDQLKGTQYLWNRQNVGWVYSQRGGVGLVISGDQLAINFHGRHRQPERMAKIKAGEWQHVVMTIASDKPQKRALCEIWVNGVKVGSNMHANSLHITRSYMELLGQVNREKTELKTTAGLGYDDVKESLLRNSFKGEVKDVRIFDAALPASAIRELAK